MKREKTPYSRMLTTRSRVSLPRLGLLVGMGLMADYRDLRPPASCLRAFDWSIFQRQLSRKPPGHTPSQQIHDFSGKLLLHPEKPRWKVSSLHEQLKT